MTHYYSTREEWLQNASALLASERFAPEGYSVPPVNVSVGFPFRARSGRNTAIGQCWPSVSASNGLATLFISPVLTEPTRVLGVLAHELVHAVVGNEAGHKKPFSDCAAKIGLVKPWTATTESDAFKQWAVNALSVLGEYPNPAFVAADARGKQSTRLLKAECPSCGYVIRVTAKWAAFGLPVCSCPDAPSFQLTR